MCLKYSNIKGITKWNWDGDVILHDAIVPSSRPAVGSDKEYDIDVREFLVHENNTVLHRELFENIKAYVQKHGGDWNQFLERRSGSFDYRANIIWAYISETIRYKSARGRDAWQFPDETLALKTGDCEDISFVIASLMLAGGISGYNIRLVLGKVRDTVGKAKPEEYDHMWVMYKTEIGKWRLIEPLLKPVIPKARGKQVGQRRIPRKRIVEYVPFYVFNDRHVWSVLHDDNTSTSSFTLKKQWRRINPKFAGEWHEIILLERALKDIAPDVIKEKLKKYFVHAVAIFDKIDVRSYHPFDHFDNGYINEGWQQIQERLDVFKKDNNNIEAFAYAAHAIADFYAHTSYCHFARIENPGAGKDERAMLYDPNNRSGCFANLPVYIKDATFDLTSPSFSVNAKNTVPKTDIPAMWEGEVISGRYAQKGDSDTIWKIINRGVPDGAIEAAINIPEGMEEKEDFPKRWTLPHHNEIAVDKKEIKASNVLYKEKNRNPRLCWENQFKWRVNTAVAHIRKAFMENYDR
ncbi:MAG: transglutaminase domain-containing protein [bacterium]